MEGWVKPVKLTGKQRREIIGTLDGFKRSPRLRDPAVQAQIIRRIEGALTKMESDSELIPARSADRLRKLAKAKTDKEINHAYVALQPHERDLLDLAASRRGKFDFQVKDDAAYAAESLKLARGEKYGKTNENKSRFLASQLIDLFEVALQIRAGHGDKSTFRALLDVICGELGFPILGRDAIEALTHKGSDPHRA